MFARILALLCLLSAALEAQHSPEMHAAMHGGAAALTTPGESISGTLSEVIATLDEEETTDWSRVDLDALVRHLRQMHLLFTYAEVQSTEITDGVRHEITGTPAVMVAAREMVTTHAAMVGSELGWRARVKAAEDRVVVTVESTNEGAVARLRALGFFGFMAAGGHHQKHHLMLAKGMAPHGAHQHRPGN